MFIKHRGLRGNLGDQSPCSNKVRSVVGIPACIFRQKQKVNSVRAMSLAYLIEESDERKTCLVSGYTAGQEFLFQCRLPEPITPRTRAFFETFVNADEQSRIIPAKIVIGVNMKGERCVRFQDRHGNTLTGGFCRASDLASIREEMMRKVSKTDRPDLWSNMAYDQMTNRSTIVDNRYLRESLGFPFQVLGQVCRIL